MEIVHSTKRFFDLGNILVNFDWLTEQLGCQMQPLASNLYFQTALELAPQLLGKLLLVIDSGGTICGGRIVETEAYHESKPSSHSFRGKTKRNAEMFGPGGRSYIYRSYGIHWCFNVVSGKEGVGEAVLVRAVEPLWGLELMQARRGPVLKPNALSNGPGKLCQALSISDRYNGSDFTKGPIILADDFSGSNFDIIACERIGISKATELPWRFFIKGHPFVSKPSASSLSRQEIG